MTKVLNVDEVHVTDEKGILLWGSIPEYYGLDFAATDQTRPFMPALKDKNFEMAQEPQLNGSIGKLFQYISVSRKDKTGIVQVGVVPEVLDEALANNKIDVVIGNFNVSEGENVIAIDKKTGKIVADSDKKYIGNDYSRVGINKECFELKKNSEWIKTDGVKNFAIYDEYNDFILAVCFTDKYLSEERKNQNVIAVLSSLLLSLIIIAAIFILLKKVIINDIDAVNKDLNQITCGDLNVVVTAKATPEFSQLSEGINEMVDSLKTHIAEIASQASELDENNKNILASLKYARRIQNNLLPSQDAFDDVFKDYSILWEPKDVVGGDIYWIKHFDHGSVLCVCDCTGHGTPGALLTMLVVTALDAVVTPKNYKEPDEIMWELDKKLINTLNSADSATEINDGADLAILYISNDNDIVLASANTHLFICDGETVQDIKGQKISLGEGNLNSKDIIETVKISADSKSKYYVASDGLFDQIGGKNGIPFGYKKFKEIITVNHNMTQKEIMDKVWAEFKVYMGEESRRDDITLLSFLLNEMEEC